MYWQCCFVRHQNHKEQRGGESVLRQGGARSENPIHAILSNSDSFLSPPGSQVNNAKIKGLQSHKSHGDPDDPLGLKM